MSEREGTFEIAPDQRDLAWAAGFLDGEGYFGADKNGARHPTVEAAQVATDAPLRILRSMFGGSLRSTPRAHRWVLCSAPGLRLALPLLIPYLVVKRQQAEALLFYAHLFQSRGATKVDPITVLARCHWANELLRLRRPSPHDH